MQLKHVNSSALDQAATPHRPVIIFDSGVGGINIYEKASAIRPELNYLVIADQAFFPYGSKTIEALHKRLSELVQQFAALDPCACIIACNTASTIALPLFREVLSCPVVGTVPPIKPAAESSKTKSIGLLATPATVQRSYIDELIQDHAKDCQVLRIGSEQLALLSEQKLAGHSIDHNLLKQELEAFIKNPNIDTIALGCTHYHHLTEEIQTLLPHCTIIDCSDAIARQFCKLCSEAPKNQFEHLFIQLN